MDVTSGSNVISPIGTNNTTVPPMVVHVQTTSVSHGEKSEKFSGMNFKRWQQKMLFYLTTLNLAKFLTEDAPAVQEGTNNMESLIALDAWKHSDFLCKNYILSGLDNTLYGVYSAMKSAKELWESLEKKYKTEDAGTKKFIVGKFLDYKMVDSKTIISQVQELHVLLHDIHVENMTVSESFQVDAIIEKLPPLWRDFKNYLKHKRKEMNLEELIVRLRIEEDNRKSEKKSGGQFVQEKANMVESSSKKNKKRKFSGDVPKKDNKKNAKKFKGSCYNCEKTGHRASECRNPKKQNAQAHMTEGDTLSNDIQQIPCLLLYLNATILEIPGEWWVDTGATRHVCADKGMFSNYNAINGEQLFMGNSSSSKVEGQGKWC